MSLENARGIQAVGTLTRKKREELVAQLEDSLRTVAGVRTNELALQLGSQIVALQLWNTSEDFMDNYVTALSLLSEMRPKTATAAMLAVQMIGVHQQATILLARGNSESTLLSIRLMRLFGDQLVAYEKLQGMVPQQKVTVEHVHVHQGGQAIVGAVSSSKSRPRRKGSCQ